MPTVAKLAALVMAAWVAPVTVAAVPLTLPVTSPVRSPVTSPVTLPVTLPVKAPVKVVAVTALSFSNTESIVTPAAAVVSAIVSVVTF